MVCIGRFSFLISTRKKTSALAPRGGKIIWVENTGFTRRNRRKICDFREDTIRDLS